MSARIIVMRNVTAEQIVSAAMELTHEHTLEGWTVRRLADAVGSYPAVIYHHVGDRERVVEAVVDRVAALVLEATPAVPEGDDPPWRTWLRQYAGNVRALLIYYPGVARRLAVNAAADTGGAPALHRLLTQVFEHGRFGADANAAARLLLITMTSLITVEDDRQRLGGPSWLTFSEGFQLYASGIDCCLAGLAARRAEGPS
jgi:AcrR family transcriptional regulator